MHTTEPVDAWYVPTPHGLQEAAAAAEYLPAEQLVHALALEAVYNPAAHSRQLEDVVLGWYVPAAHEVQLLAPAAE